MTKSEMMMKELPPDLYQEVEDFIQFLVEKRGRKASTQFQLDWKGALNELSSQHTSVELQHTIHDEWIQHVSD